MPDRMSMTASEQTKPVPLSAAIDTVRIGVRSRFPALWLETHEEKRAISEIADMASKEGMDIYLWSCASGIRLRLSDEEKAADKTGAQYRVPKGAEETEDPNDALSWALNLTASGEADKLTGEPKKVKALFIFAELDELLEADLKLRRRFREVAEDVRMRIGKYLLVVTPRINAVPVSLQKTVTLVSLPVPTRDQLQVRVESLIATYKARKKGAQLVQLDDAGVEKLVNAATGLTRDGLDRALSMALTEYGCLDGRAITLVQKEKRQLVDGTGFLQYEEPAATLSDVGGQDLMKTWLQQRMKAFGPSAREYGLTEPKGVLVCGAPGTGKSLGAKAAAAAWGRPLLRLDVGALFGGIVGESERNTRQAIELIEAMSPCVLWIDEIEKGLSGMASSGSTDGGTTARVFQSLLTWLNEKKSAVFVFATANDPTKLPPELLRKGRLDEIFAIGLPSHSEREEVIAIHIGKRKRDPANFDIKTLAVKTRGFSGAELEQVVLDAMFAAFHADREFTTEDLIMAAESTNPMSKTMRERILQMEAWAQTRARPASSSTGQELAKDGNFAETTTEQILDESDDLSELMSK